MNPNGLEGLFCVILEVNEQDFDCKTSITSVQTLEKESSRFYQKILLVYLFEIFQLLTLTWDIFEQTSNRMLIWFLIVSCPLFYSNFLRKFSISVYIENKAV